MSGAWQEVAFDPPPNGVPVETKIHDGAGERNHAVLKRSDRLWFLPDGSMYVYYTPTHWRPSPPSKEGE
jgi:hypothetical protein